MRQHIFTDKGAEPKGPYSQAIVAEGRYVFVSGQGPVDPATGELRLGTDRTRGHHLNTRQRRAVRIDRPDDHDPGVTLGERGRCVHQQG